VILGQSWLSTELNLIDKTASDFCRRLLPTFAQADLLVRAHYADPAAGYIPPFIILMPLSVSGKARVLFTKPSHMLPQAFAQSWPSYCLNPACGDSNCGMIDFTKSRCLAEGTAMVREGPWLPHRVICNLWGCEQKRNGGDVRMKCCERCKEVIYCDHDHQVPLGFALHCLQLTNVCSQKLDWGHHRKVCEWRR